MACVLLFYAIAQSSSWLLMEEEMHFLEVTIHYWPLAHSRSIPAAAATYIISNMAKIG